MYIVVSLKTKFKRHMPGEFHDYSWVIWSRHCSRKGARRVEKRRKKKKTKMTKVDFHRFQVRHFNTVPLTSKWTNTRGRLAGNPGVVLSCPRNRVSLTAGRCEYRVHHALVQIRASTVYARESHTTTKWVCLAIQQVTSACKAA